MVDGERVRQWWGYHLYVADGGGYGHVNDDEGGQLLGDENSH